MSKTIIFLDFDGVLCDSVKEAYILSRYAYYGFDVHKPIENDRYEKFANYRYLIQNSWQYYYLMQILEKHLEFDMLIANGKTMQADQFNKKFLAKRKELMEKEFDFWNGLETPTLFLTKLKNIIKNSKNCEIAILSTKNKEAIIKKFNFWKFDFNNELIFDKKDLENQSKGDFIENYLIFHKEYQDAILIDDNEGNINSCANIENLQAHLTSWGYVKNPPKAKTEEEILEIIKEKL
jgi:hypothetical protein